MKLYFLGTGSAYPTAKRGVSSLALHLDDGQVWLFDCGEGTQIQIQKMDKEKLAGESDSCPGAEPGDLPASAYASSRTERLRPAAKGKAATVVDIYGPRGLWDYVNTSLTLSRSLLLFKYKVHELVPVKAQFLDDWSIWPDVALPPIIHPHHPSEECTVELLPITSPDGDVEWELVKSGSMTVKAGWLHHRVPAFGFFLTEADKPGTLDVRKLKDLGVKPGPICSQLKSGHSVVLENGRVITPDMVLGPLYPGRMVAILGDTSDPSPAAHLVRRRRYDVVVHESTHDDTLNEKARAHGHSTPRMAAEFARLATAKTLLLNHFSQRYVSEDEAVSDPSNSIALIKQQAEAALTGTDTAVLCSHDLFCYTITQRPRHTNT